MFLAFFAGAVSPVNAGDPDGWNGAAWGMTGPELDRVFDDRITRLAAPLDFGPLYTDRMIRPIELGGHAFSAFLQMDRTTDRMAQVLLDIRRLDAPDRVMADIVMALVSRHGEPTCEVLGVFPDGETIPMTAIWTSSDTTIQAGLIDLNVPGILTEDPNTERDVRRPLRERQRIKRSALPRRVTVRYHPASRKDLDLGACMPTDG